MPGRVDVSVSKADIARVQVMLRGIPDGAERAQTRALNSVANKSRTEVVRRASRNVNLTQAFLKERILGPAQRPGNKATFTSKAARITAAWRGLVLSHFMNRKRTLLQEVNGRQRARVEVKVASKGRYIRMPSAFLMRLRRGTESGDTFGVFQRQNGQLKHLYGPSPSQIFHWETPKMAEDFQTQLELQMDREITGVLRQYAK